MVAADCCECWRAVAVEREESFAVRDRKDEEKVVNLSLPIVLKLIKIGCQVTHKTTHELGNARKAQGRASHKAMLTIESDTREKLRKHSFVLVTEQRCRDCGVLRTFRDENLTPLSSSPCKLGMIASSRFEWHLSFSPHSTKTAIYPHCIGQSCNIYNKYNKDASIAGRCRQLVGADVR